MFETRCSITYALRNQRTLHHKLLAIFQNGFQLIIDGSFLVMFNKKSWPTPFNKVTVVGHPPVEAIFLGPEGGLIRGILLYYRTARLTHFRTSNLWRNYHYLLLWSKPVNRLLWSIQIVYIEKYSKSRTGLINYTSDIKVRQNTISWSLGLLIIQVV